MHTLKEKAAIQKVKLQKLAELACKPNEDCGRDNESAVVSHVGPMNWGKGWNKGWGKYGKT